MGASALQLAQVYPTLYHMAEPGSWPSIKKHGLLSTGALVDLFGVKGEDRERLLTVRRPESIRLEHPELGTAVVRDQKPLHDSKLAKVLKDGLTPADWYRILNGHVFFWPTQERLDTFMSAKAYRDERKTVLHIRAAPFFSDNAARILLSPINSGSTSPIAWPRGHDTFLPLDKFPFEERWRMCKHKAVAEVAVPGSVSGIAAYVEQVIEVGGGEPTLTLWRP